VALIERMSVGVDVQDVSAFEDWQLPEQRRLIERVFTERERAWCLSMPHPAQHLAARFAAKEALIKALAPFEPASFEQIEIERGDDGRPHVRLSIATARSYAVRLSLSHSESQAVAVALLERIPDGE
jgi:phosphopantetheine--protein transferase-like protein